MKNISLSMVGELSLLRAENKRGLTRALHTGSKAWAIIRQRILVRDLYTCQKCAASGNEVDHKNGDSSDQRDSNLWVLCRPCHSTKTASQDHGFGN